MLAIPDCLGDAILEADHIVLPVSHMRADFLPYNRGRFIISEEVKVEHVHVSTSMIIHHDGRRDCPISLSASVRPFAIEPRRFRCNIINGRQVHVWVVDCCQIVERQRARGVYRNKVFLRLGMSDLRPNVGGEVSLLGLEP